MKILFPEIENVSIANHSYTDSLNNKNIVVVLYTSKKELPNSSKLAPWLEKRLSKENVQIYRLKEQTPEAIKPKANNKK